MIEPNGQKLSELKKLKKRKKSKEYYANQLGITIEEVNILLQKLNKDIKEYEEEITKSVNINKGTVESSVTLDYEPKTIDELYDLHKIDKNLYKISNYWSKLKSSGKFTSSVLATLKKPKDYSLEDFTKFLQNWKPKKPTAHYDIGAPIRDKDVVDVELNIADFHLAKKTFEGDTLDKKEFDYHYTVRDLINKVLQNYNINKIVFPISNDFFHSDTYQNTTTNGTPQDVTAWYDEEYERGFEILADTINFLKTKCNDLEVILVQGNHDRTKGFFVAHALSIFFSEDKTIKFQREHSTLKAVKLGNTFIGYHHGNNVKLQDLPLIFATGKYASLFGEAKYREIHTGDKHHYMAKEIQGVRIQQMPSLSKTDRWHRDNSFENKIHAALAIVYHPIHGKIAEFEHRI